MSSADHGLGRAGITLSMLLLLLLLVRLLLLTTALMLVMAMLIVVMLVVMCFALASLFLLQECLQQVDLVL